MFRNTLLILSLWGAALTFGQDAEVVRNPFKTPTVVSTGPVNPVEAVTTLDPFEFNGFMWWDGKLRISVFDTKANKSYWLDDGVTNELGLSFQRFDKSNESVVLAQGGITKRLSLNKVKIEALKMPVVTAAPSTAPMVSAADRPPTPSNVESDEEARARIQKVSDEIRRRRAERRQQLEQRQSQGATN